MKKFEEKIWIVSGKMFATEGTECLSKQVAKELLECLKRDVPSGGPYKIQEFIISTEKDTECK